ncbi:MAG: cellulose biosynthesis protein BcsD [Stenotrophomonas sp.]
MHSPELLDYYRAHACSRQWRLFLLALAEEFDSALPEAELARLMARIGERFAQAHGLPLAATLEELQAAANAVWSQIDWGCVVFEESVERVCIHHAASPLSAVLGGKVGWHTGFLEGVYRQWFRAAGMLPVLDIRHTPSELVDVSTYTLSRVS